jgi:hypothetical protein
MGIPRSDRATAVKDVADFVKESMLDYYGDGVSPVTGDKFKRLSKDYAKFKRGQSSSAYANMELTGEMLDALEYKIKGSKIEIGWFGGVDAKKAFNHTTGDTLPKRPLVPTARQKFDDPIEEGITEILDAYRAAED